VFCGLAGLAGPALARDDHVADAHLVQGVIDALLAVAAVGSDGPGTAPGAADDPPDGGRQLRGVGRVALLQGVVRHDLVVVIGHLGFVAELDWLAEPSLGDRPGVGVVQADSPVRPARG
jgi:hypothetical protein